MLTTIHVLIIKPMHAHAKKFYQLKSQSQLYMHLATIYSCTCMFLEGYSLVWKNIFIIIMNVNQLIRGFLIYAIVASYRELRIYAGLYNNYTTNLK